VFNVCVKLIIYRYIETQECNFRKWNNFYFGWKFQEVGSGFGTYMDFLKYSTDSTTNSLLIIVLCVYHDTKSNINSFFPSILLSCLFLSSLLQFKLLHIVHQP